MKRSIRRRMRRRRRRRRSRRRMSSGAREEKGKAYIFEVEHTTTGLGVCEKTEITFRTCCVTKNSTLNYKQYIQSNAEGICMIDVVAHLLQRTTPKLDN